MTRRRLWRQDQLLLQGDADAQIVILRLRRPPLKHHRPSLDLLHAHSVGRWSVGTLGREACDKSLHKFCTIYAVLRWGERRAIEAADPGPRRFAEGQVDGELCSPRDAQEIGAGGDSEERVAASDMLDVRHVGKLRYLRDASSAQSVRPSYLGKRDRTLELARATILVALQLDSSSLEERDSRLYSRTITRVVFKIEVVFSRLSGSGEVGEGARAQGGGLFQSVSPPWQPLRCASSAARPPVLR